MVRLQGIVLCSSIVCEDLNCQASSQYLSCQGFLSREVLYCFQLHVCMNSLGHCFLASIIYVNMQNGLMQGKYGHQLIANAHGWQLPVPSCCWAVVLFSSQKRMVIIKPNSGKRSFFWLQPTIFAAMLFSALISAMLICHCSMNLSLFIIPRRESGSS